MSYDEVNGLSDPETYHREVTYKIKQAVYWTEPGLYITRLRLLSYPGFPMWDVSYCHGTINGEPVNVLLPFDQLPRKGLKRAIARHAKVEGVSVEFVGVLDNLSLIA